VVAIAHGRGDQARAAGGLVVVCAAQFVIGVDGLAVAVALPSLQRDLELTTGQVQWVLTAFGLGFGGLLLLGGRLGDLYGRRRLLVAGLALFVAGSPVAAWPRPPARWWRPVRSRASGRPWPCRPPWP
jgi:MFS family permease